MADQLTMTRRRALAIGAGIAGAGLLPGIARARTGALAQHGRLPAQEIQKIIGIEGSVTDGVLGMSCERKDIGTVQGPLGVHLRPSFELNGDLYFQPLGSNHAFFNGDLALKASELNAVIDAIVANGLVFQAMHQHYFNLRPMVWFIHFRGTENRSRSHARYATCWTRPLHRCRRRSRRNRPRHSTTRCSRTRCTARRRSATTAS